MFDHERICIEQCGCRYDWKTGIVTHVCPEHRAKEIRKRHREKEYDDLPARPEITGGDDD